MEKINDTVNRYFVSSNSDILADYRAAFNYIQQNRVQSPKYEVQLVDLQERVVNHFIILATKQGYTLKDLLSMREKTVIGDCVRILDARIASTDVEEQHRLEQQFNEMYSSIVNADTKAMLSFIKKKKDILFVQAQKLRGIETEQFQVTTNKYKIANDAIERLTATNIEELVHQYSMIGDRLAKDLQDDEELKQRDKQGIYGKFHSAYLIKLEQLEILNDDYDVENPKYTDTNTLIRMFRNRQLNCTSEEELEALKEEYFQALAYRFQHHHCDESTFKRVSKEIYK